MANTFLDRTALNDLLNGACFLGGGGGGPMSGARPLIDLIVKEYDGVTLVPYDSLDPELPCAVVAGIGAPDAATHGPSFSSAPKDAFLKLQAVSGTTLGAVLPGETGAMNSIIAALVAAQLGLPLVDVDSSGRALPTLSLAAYNLATEPTVLTLANQPVTDEQQATAVIETRTAPQADSVVRALLTTQAFEQEGAFSTWLMTAGQLPGASVDGTVTRAIAVGAALREARAAGDDPVEAVNAVLDGQLVRLSCGTLTAFSSHEGGGFDGYTIVLTDDDGHVVTVSAVNENLLAWRSDSDAPLAAAPDTLAWLAEDGTPLSNTDLRGLTAGTRLHLLGIPAAPILRTPLLAARFAKELAGIGFFGQAPRLD
ncbi:DUF917 domain-containing protein [Paludibacterium paludis]|uniref:DUF917 family protein n=1 Tax=Paludibacterium paludis TaxID=1225769 RepID=A0A918NXN6_9NEIS|nr:DUF917 domain-containing protein [Paludibacterium paludis]GGY04925.1 hypothetical protein GCM10011289_04340 [Paludibacterium paludis]